MNESRNSVLFIMRKYIETESLALVIYVRLTVFYQHWSVSALHVMITPLWNILKQIKVLVIKNTLDIFLFYVHLNPRTT